jgi:hypothetical protein
MKRNPGEPRGCIPDFALLDLGYTLRRHDDTVRREFV